MEPLRRYLPLIQRVNNGTASPREVIKLHCLEGCKEWMHDKGKTLVQTVAECTETDCRFHNYRPR